MGGIPLARNNQAFLARSEPSPTRQMLRSTGYRQPPLPFLLPSCTRALLAGAHTLAARHRPSASSTTTPRPLSPSCLHGPHFASPVHPHSPSRPSRLAFPHWGKRVYLSVGRRSRGKLPSFFGFTRLLSLVSTGFPQLRVRGTSLLSRFGRKRCKTTPEAAQEPILNAPLSSTLVHMPPLR